MSNSAGAPTAPPTRHKSVEALLAAHQGHTDPKKLIRKLAREKIAYAKLNGWEGPPFSPIFLAGIFGIRCKMVDHDLGAGVEGRILLYPDGKPWIEYRGDRMPERQRFTIFHEFAHTLFPDYCKFLPLHHAQKRAPRDPEKEFENLCDAGAAEMLLPHQEFTTDLSEQKSLGFEAIHKLRKRYEASIDATVHRTVDLWDESPCVAVFLTDQQGKHTGNGPLWVKYSSPNSLFNGFIRPGSPVPRNSVAVICYRDGIDTSEPVQETWLVDGQPRTWLVQATKLPSTDNPDYAKVVVLILPSSYGQNFKGRLNQS